MDKLTRRGYKYIIAQKGMLTAFARERIAAKDLNVGSEWIGFDITRHKPADASSKEENCIDIHFYLPDDKPDTADNWQAWAYPSEVNSVNMVQTNTDSAVEVRLV